MKCVVTGGSGFIGTNLLNAIVLSKQFSTVVSLDAVPSPRVVPGVDSVQLDIRDLASLSRPLKDADIVFHLAASANVDRIKDDPLFAVENNISATATVLEASRRAGVRRFVFASTVWVYIGATDFLLTEDTMLFPAARTNLYASTKIASELLCRTYEEQYGLGCTILRFDTPYGPYMRPELVVHRFVHLAMNGLPLTIAGGGDQTRHFIHVRDLSECAILAAISPIAAGKTYNVIGPRPVSIRELAEVVRDSVSGVCEVTSVDGRPSDSAGRSIIDTVIQNELGWRPTIDIRDGIKEFLAWLNDYESFDELSETPSKRKGDSTCQLQI